MDFRSESGVRQWVRTLVLRSIFYEVVAIEAGVINGKLGFLGYPKTHTLELIHESRIANQIPFHQSYFTHSIFHKFMKLD